MAKLALQSVSAFVLAGVTMVYAVAGGGIPLKTLIDIHGLVIVIGGTVAATAISFKPSEILIMLRASYRGMFSGRGIDYRSIVQELTELAQVYRDDPESVRARLKKTDDFFIREAMTLMLDEIASEKELKKILQDRSESVFERYVADAKKFKSIGKYPPAMGLMGAVLGMIALLGGLGTPGAEKTVGPAMSVALVATFYGIALANLIIIPVGENLVDRAQTIKLKNDIIVSGVILIQEKTNPLLLVEKLNSYLLPAERLKWKG
jgi:chemotaxis protein MotA